MLKIIVININFLYDVHYFFKKCVFLLNFKINKIIIIRNKIINKKSWKN